MNPLDLEEDETIQRTLQELCVAGFVQNYCSACASGEGCCAASPTCGSGSEEGEEETRSETWEDGGREKMNGVGTGRRRTLTIDLSKDEELSDGEILKRLLSPIGSPLSDEPLEVILEIVDEDDEDDGEDDEEGGSALCNSDGNDIQMSFASLREKLREVTKSNGRNSFRSKRRELNKKAQITESNCPRSSVSRPFPSVQNFPSFRKANSLINEIERCFLETANLVERTLGPTKDHPIQEQESEERSIFSNETDINSNLTHSIQDALNIFDSIISEAKANDKSEHGGSCSEQSESKAFYEVSECDQDSGGDHECYDSSIPDNNEHHRNWYSQVTYPIHDYSLRQMPKMKYTTGFERDVDELFKECYELSSVEPSTSLGSCLKNLESLCVQLNRAKENIFLEMKEEYRKKFDYNNGSFDHFGSNASSLDSQECLSFINELIEKKLKEKLRHEKFSLGPPLMGLEGRTHKIIAEVLPQKSYIENNPYIFKENEFQNSTFMDNYSNFQDVNYNSSDTMNSLYRDNFHPPEAFFESNSEISTMTRTLDSNLYMSTSSQTESSRNDDTNKYSLSGSFEDDQNSIMNYDETLALYEDNQELQRSLLSILHSLNDIHDNFLNRRRIEMDISQKSSDFIQNHIKAEINLSDGNGNTFSLPKLLNTSMQSENIYTKETLIPNDTCNFPNRFTQDFDSIEKITEVSDELKNLWLYQTRDLKLRNRKPSRSVSFNRGVKRYEHANDSYGDSRHSETMNEKSMSMPNLSVNEAGSPNLYQKAGRPQTGEPNFFAENFVRQMKDENAKCYEVTLNFLQRIMAACDVIDTDKGDNGTFLPPPQHPYPYNAYMRTCQ